MKYHWINCQAYRTVGIQLMLNVYPIRIIIGSDRRPETKQGIEGKIVRFRSGRVRVRVRDRLALGIRIADLVSPI